MLYEQNMKETVLDTLNERVSSISDCIIRLLDEGFVPNKNKATIIDWSSILIHAYENIDVLTLNQHKNLDNLFNKVMQL